MARDAAEHEVPFCSGEGNGRYRARSVCYAPIRDLPWFGLLPPDDEVRASTLVRAYGCLGQDAQYLLENSCVGPDGNREVGDADKSQQTDSGDRQLRSKAGGPKFLECGAVETTYEGHGQNP